MADSFSVVPFTAESFSLQLVSEGCTEADVATDERVTYLAAYLGAIEIKTIVTEHEYTDADYLDDYASFYAKSFGSISNRCRRLHFFRIDFTEEAFHALVVSGDPEGLLQTSYGGFIVARPLPTAVIGRTVLQTYPSDFGRRWYPATRSYLVNLYGISLSLVSLAFQEQDTSLAACATVALWSCFQKAQDLFHSAAPTPAAITRAANKVVLGARPFPSRGLQIHQVCNAIAAVGLDTEVYEVTQDLPLVSLIYSYVRVGLPVLAVVTVGNDWHAIDINGFSLRETRQLAKEASNVDALLPALIGSRIDELYGHDDQQGPFCRLKLVAPNASSDVVVFTNTGWQHNLVPKVIVVPVYPKIRTGFRETTKWLLKLSTVASWGADPNQFEWDVYLMASNRFKEALQSGEVQTTAQLKGNLLFSQLPKYIWRCTLRISGSIALEMLLDTTAMVKGFPIIQLWWVDENLKTVAGAIVNNPSLQQSLSAPQIFGARLLTLLGKSCL